MNLPSNFFKLLLNAEAKALATVFNNDINVVPVSSVKVVDAKIWLVDYFFNKTALNIQNNPVVSLTFWTDLKGYQVKAKAKYLTKGEAFVEAVKWISIAHPNRIVKGLVVLEIEAVFDISIDKKVL